MVKNYGRWLMAIGLVLALAGCEDARRSLGLARTAPDEFAVVSRAPLTMPPDYQLKPPRPGATRPQESAARDQAAEAVLGSRYSTDGVSEGEKLLLAKAGTDKADPNIREKVDQESALMTASETSFVDDILFWRKKHEPGTVVNPQQEYDRLKTNAQTGRAVTAGETPMIERKSRAPIDSLF